MNGELFRYQRKLQTLVLRQTPVNFTMGFFTHLTWIRQLHIEQSIARNTLRFNTFDLLYNVAELRMVNNSLTTLPSGLLQRNVNLKSLTIIEPDLISQPEIDDLIHLTELTLSSTSIDWINGNFFRETFKLTYVDMSNNKLKSWPDIDHLQHLVTLNLANNKLKRLPTQIQWNSKMVWDLSGNQIDRISTFYSQWLQVASINLTNNGLKTIDFSDSRFLTRCGTVTITLHLDGNPINCDESLIDFIACKDNPKNEEKITVVGGECHTPDSLAGRPLSEIDLNDVIHQKRDFNSKFCSNDCDCNFRRFDAMFVMNCTNDGLRQLRRFPDTKQFGYDFIELYFAGQNVTEFPNITHIAGIANVIAVNASNNNIRHLTRAMFSDNLKSLDLSKNALVSVDEDMLKSWEESGELERVWLSDNPWECNCDAQLLKAFIYSNISKVLDYREIVCANKAGKPLHLVDGLCPASSHRYIVIITLCLAALFVTLLFTFYYKYRLLVSVWLYAKFGRSIGRYLAERPFDAFISFAEADDDYVYNQLVPALEDGPEQYRLCIHTRDWIAAPIIEQIYESVRDSRYTIVVLSRSYLRSNWCVEEFRAAQLQANNEKRTNVIMVMYGDINDQDVKESVAEMRAYLSANTYLRWDDPWFLKKLRYSLRRSRRERRAGRAHDNEVIEMSVQQISELKSEQ